MSSSASYVFDDADFPALPTMVFERELSDAALREICAQLSQTGHGLFNVAATSEDGLPAASPLLRSAPSPFSPAEDQEMAAWIAEMDADQELADLMQDMDAETVQEVNNELQVSPVNNCEVQCVPSATSEVVECTPRTVDIPNIPTFNRFAGLKEERAGKRKRPADAISPAKRTRASPAKPRATARPNSSATARPGASKQGAGDQQQGGGPLDRAVNDAIEENVTVPNNKEKDFVLPAQFRVLSDESYNIAKFRLTTRRLIIRSHGDVTEFIQDLLACLIPQTDPEDRVALSVSSEEFPT